MPTSFLEIVEMPDGRIVLRRADDEEALVTLEFSGDAKNFLQGQHVEVAKAMFNVGVQMAGRLAEGEMEHDEGPASCTERCPPPFFQPRRIFRLCAWPSWAARDSCLRAARLSGSSQLTTVWLRPRRKASQLSARAAALSFACSSRMRSRFRPARRSHSWVRLAGGAIRSASGHPVPR